MRLDGDVRGHIYPPFAGVTLVFVFFSQAFIFGGWSGAWTGWFLLLLLLLFLMGADACTWIGILLMVLWKMMI